MHTQYGDFAKFVSELEGNQNNVRTVWKDETACSYDKMNDEVKLGYKSFWKIFCSCEEVVKKIKSSYNHEETYKEILRLAKETENL